ncbi:hypothetical protein N5J50_15465 [Acinetobacter johnsonii]|uniref:Uncharacterized protein n=1 Tax=Acinetobacter johnsonii TaxID=40214 RepID=A0AA42XIT0_ACIJO|nr:hypothetical protein [Acinetobacter johnsonii]MDH2173843.1 hypothetical protein [Acinetobacter johnsonii]MDH2177058.1 hypothetical protein [Acinetobacter johnsonii]
MGDIFSVDLEHGTKKYFQLIAYDQFTSVGELEGENRKAEIGVAVNPFDIVQRIKTGHYDFVYPQFE